VEFDVTKVEDVEWNTEAFEHLVLPTSHKNLLQSLVEAHHAELGFDDFIRGKGQGLVINLFGPPGVGKTFSAEATSEHVRRPLYLVGAGDLGTSAAALDIALERVFEIATAWKAIVLIDEVHLSPEIGGSLLMVTHRLMSSWNNVPCMTWKGMLWSLSCKPS
jgi:SpoVK/Ycf46/Vps4 family AAA+-type ATPase